MKLKHAFIAMLFIRCLFLAFPDKMISPFIFPSKEMETVTAYSYAFLFFESISFLALVFLIILIGANRYKLTWERTKCVIAFGYMCGLDFIDFIIRGNSEWFYLGRYPVTSNVFMMACYVVLTWNIEE